MNSSLTRTPWIFFSFVIVFLSGCETVPSPKADESQPAGQEVAVQKEPTPSSVTRPSPPQSMDRMIRELEGKPPLPSDTRAPSPSPEQRGEGTDAEAPSPKGDTVQMSATGPCPPTWWQRRDARGFIEGIGGSATSQNDAEAHARLDVAKTLEVKIDSTDTIQQQETTGGDFSYSVQSTVVERVDLSLSGLTIQKTVACQNQWYALARLDRSRAENAWRTDLSALDSEAEAFRAQIAIHEQKGEAFHRLLTLYRLMVVEETASQIQQRFPRLTGKKESEPSRAGSVKQSLDNYESLLGSFQVKTFGDGQQAVDSPQLPNPLVVQVLAGDVPVPHVPVQFTLMQGQVEVPSTAWTDAQGKAQGVVRYSIETEDPARIEAHVDLDQVTHEFPDVPKKQLHKHREQLTARFDVLPPVYHLLKKKKQLTGEGEILKTKIQTSRGQGTVFLMMDHLSQLHSVQKEWAQIIERLQHLHPPSGEGGKNPGDPKDTHHQLDRLVTSFEFRMLKGSDQQAVLGRALEETLQAQLVVRISGKEVPVSQVPVRFEFEEGKGDVDPLVSTNVQGQVQVQVHRVEPAEGKNNTEAIIVARLDITNLGQSLPSSFQEQLHNHLSNQVLRFRITPPRGCVSVNPFDEPLYKLACDLVGQTDEWVGKRTVVRGFVERASRKHHPLSARIEEALVAGLTLTHQLQVLQFSNAADAAASRNSEVEVTGTYEQIPDGLNVKASFVPLTVGVAAAVSETIIPLEALPKADWSSLSPPPSPHIALPVVPNSKDFPTHEKWVTAFWQHANPQATFQTWIKPKESVFHEEEKATFLFKTERDCYLWVFNIGASGNGAVLLPNKHRPNPQQTLVRASQGWVHVPDPSDGFEFPISPPFGIERVKTICTTRPVSIIPRHVIQGLSNNLPLFLFSRSNHRFRDLGVAPSGIVELKPEEWSEAHTKVVTLKKGQKETRGMRGLRSRGLVLKE